MATSDTKSVDISRKKFTDPKIRPWPITIVLAFYNFCAVFSGFFLLGLVPAEILLWIFRVSPHIGKGDDAIILLSFGMKCALVATAGGVLLFSAVVAGLMRSLMRDGMFARSWLIACQALATLSLFAWMGYIVKEMTAAIRSSGDNLLVVAFLAAWILAIGYACKTPWDELRDRCCDFFGRHWAIRK